ncbi:MAG: hypothetical protein HFH75_18270 [Lachnospiraceae bacterium]|jgi:hypothetical protein|nr:hypothetical protein [Lachnospiraceae bacterium]MDE7000944.1 hypothetical protein [Lachnospiraceae bacterium]
MNTMDKKSISFLLDHAGPVIQYRLRKEIIGSISAQEEKDLLEEIYGLPLFRLVQKYVKPNGYIGNGMHSWDNWRGTVLHETPLQDGESAARLLCYYAIPKEHPIVAGFVRAMRDAQIMRQEFSYIPPEIERYDNRFICIRNGNCLGAMLYTVQAMLGYGDDHEDLIAFQQIALKGFERILQMSSLEEILKKRKGVEKKNKLPYIESDEYFPNAYTLSALAYTKTWRTEKNIQMLADALNHINRIMKPDNQMHVKTKSRYYAPCFALVTPIRAFDPDYISTITYRRILTEIAMLGVGVRVGVVKESLEAISAATDDEGILKMNFGQPHNKRYSPLKIEYPTPYVDVRLEEDYKKGHGLDCDLTFWAVQFKSLVENRFFLDK